MISNEVEFLRELLKDEEDMCVTIPFPIPEIEEIAYKEHQRKIIKFKQCIRKLALFEQHKWVSVKTKLPPTSEVVLGADKWSTETVELVDGDFMVVAEDHHVRGKTITHWMPLPELKE
tara:strand:+ start:7104 stop:7457 length:354 start_codon:yes stop_codon:yes gene_type:complete